MSVQSIELLQRGYKGHWGVYGYMYMGCATHGGLVRFIMCRDLGMCVIILAKWAVLED